MTTAIISVETILLLILLVLVAGLLRSHAEILRRLADPAMPAPADPRLVPPSLPSATGARRPPRSPGPPRTATRSRSISANPAAIRPCWPS